MEYKDKLMLLNVTELKKLIKDYSLQTKIVMAKKKKEELIAEILKHTDYQNGKVIIKSHSIEGNLEAKPKVTNPKVTKPIVTKPKKEVMKEESLEDKIKNYALEIKKVNYELAKNYEKYSPMIVERIKIVSKERQAKGEKMNQGKVNRLRDNIIKTEFKEYADKKNSLHKVGEKLKKEVETLLDNIKTKDMSKARELLNIYQRSIL